MPKLYELAKLIRSKNAGPFELTVDIMFDSEEDYRLVQRSDSLNESVVSELYGIPSDQIQIYYFDPAFSIKITFPRPSVSGDLRDSDVFGGQQYGPLVNLEIK